MERDQLNRRMGTVLEEEDETPWKLCFGRGYRLRVLQECHDHPTAGHLGTRKTCQRVARKYYWSGLFRKVTQYVRRCLTCQKYKVSHRKPSGQMFTRQVEEPFSVVCADFMGPLPRSRHGNTVLLVFLDAFRNRIHLGIESSAASGPQNSSCVTMVLSSQAGLSRRSVRAWEGNSNTRPLIIPNKTPPKEPTGPLKLW